MIGRGAVWLTPEQIASGFRIPTTADERQTLLDKAATVTTTGASRPAWGLLIAAAVVLYWSMKGA